MFPSYRVLSSQTTTIAECQWLFNCYLLFGGVESPTQATDDSIVFALIHIYCGQKGFSQASGFVLLAMICYQFGMVRGALGGLVLGFLCFSNNWLSVLVFVLSGICLCILYRFASIFRFVPLKVVYVAICTVAVPYFMVYLSTIGVSVFNIFSDEIIGYMLAWSPLYMFLKQPIRRFL